MSLHVSMPTKKPRKFFAGVTALVFFALITVGVLARNGWLPSTDPLTGQKTGWFGKRLPKNAVSNWNPFAGSLPLPTPTIAILPLRSRESAIYFLLAAACILAAITMAPAQAPPQTPERGAKVGNSFAVGDFEVINTTNGNLMLNFPLGSLPPGRGRSAVESRLSTTASSGT